jgi:hypothetical protein
MTSLYRTTEPPPSTSLRRTGHVRAFSVTLSKDHAGRWHWQVDWAVQYPSGSMARWERTGAATTRRAAWDAAIKEVEEERTFDGTDAPSV